MDNILFPSPCNVISSNPCILLSMQSFSCPLCPIHSNIYLCCTHVRIHQWSTCELHSLDVWASLLPTLACICKCNACLFLVGPLLRSLGCMALALCRFRTCHPTPSCPMRTATSMTFSYQHHHFLPILVPASPLPSYSRTNIPISIASCMV